MGKKRKHEVDLEAEKTLYTSFVSAANSVSQLYTQAAQQQRKGSSAASRHTLERVICHLMRECNGGDNISKTALLQFLQKEYEGLDGSDVAAQFPVHFLPTLGASSQGSMEDACETANKQRASMGSSPCVPSPARRNQQFNHNSGGAMDLSQSSPGINQAAEAYGAPQSGFLTGNLTGASFQQQQQQSTQLNVQFNSQPMYGQLPDGRSYLQQ